MAEESPFPVADLVRALRAEIAADLRGSGGNATTVTLTNGRHTGRTGDLHEYEFKTKAEQNPLNGVQVLVRWGSSWERAEAVWVAARAVRLTIAVDLGQRIPELKVRDDETAGLEQLIEKLQLVGQPGRSSVDVAKAGWMVGVGSPEVGRVSRPDELVAGYRGLGLNRFQRQAIEQALDSESTFVWGPPGTGKTEVVSRIVEGCYRQGLTVLFLAPTNVAVDQALQRICELLSREHGFENGLVQRAGRITVSSLSTAFGGFIVTDQIVGRLSGELDQRRSTVSELLDKARLQLKAYEEALELAAEVTRLREVVTTAQRSKSAHEGQHAECVAAVLQAREKLNRLGDPTGFFAERTQDKIDESNRTIARCQGEAAHHSLRIKALDNEIHSAIGQLDGLLPRLQQCERRTENLAPQASVQESVDGFEKELRQLEDALSKIADVVRSNCRVLGTTVAKAVQSRKLLDTIDVVVIDEAGMVNLPSAWYAAGLARKRVVVAGDFRQLPAVTQGSSDRNAPPEDSAHSRLWMDRDVFHAAGLVGETGSVRQDRRLVRLVEQYRMRPAICAVVNDVAYRDAPLTTGRDDTSRVPDSPLLDSSLILVDTSEHRKVLGERTIRGGHKTNAVHEAVIHELIRHLQADAVLPAYFGREEGVPTDRLAVIAPYRDQVRILQHSISQRFGVHFNGLVDTVHRFQGSQRPIVIIDTVAGASDTAGYFYEGIGPSSHTCRLLNVALSRAQDHLMVIADIEFLERTLDKGCETVRMLAHLRKHAQVVPVGDLVPVLTASELAGLPERELVKPAFFSKDEVAARSSGISSARPERSKFTVRSSIPARSNSGWTDSARSSFRESRL